MGKWTITNDNSFAFRWQIIENQYGKLIKLTGHSLVLYRLHLQMSLHPSQSRWAMYCIFHFTFSYASIFDWHYWMASMDGVLMHRIAICINYVSSECDARCGRFSFVLSVLCLSFRLSNSQSQALFMVWFCRPSTEYSNNTMKRTILKIQRGNGSGNDNDGVVVFLASAHACIARTIERTKK